MTFQTRFLFAFSLLALVTIGGGWLYTRQLTAELREAVKACETENKRQVAEKHVRNRTGEVGPWTFYQNDLLVCDPSKLDYSTSSSFGDDVTPVQRRLAQSYSAKSSAPELPATFFFSMILVLFGAAPAVWYFFLRRIREISQAIRAK